MFNFFKKKQAETKPRGRERHVCLSLDTHPHDSAGRVITLDDLVSYRGRILQVVAMSHKQKVVLREVGKTTGGFWVASRACTLKCRHEPKEG